MSSDISRSASTYGQPETGIVAQQGRVIVDRDVNALQEIVNARDAAEMRDVIGPCGAPDDGFAIAVTETSPPLLLLESPIGLPDKQAVDFSISPGTMFVGGERVVFPAIIDGTAASYSYFSQPDWPNPPIPAFTGKIHDEAVYLDVIEHELSGVEDPDLLDVALGGVDTTQRLRFIRRVERTPVDTPDCAGAWNEVTARWLARGYAFNPETMRLAAQTRLQVTLVQSSGPTDPCNPIATGGYLGAENQLIRVRIASAGSIGVGMQTATLLWGYDNASFLYRVVDTAANGTMLELAADPPDAFHTPQANQAVEILRTSTVIAAEPDNSDPSGLRKIVRCVAAETGFVTTLTQPYGPPPTGGTTKYLVLADGLPGEYLSDPNPLFVRVWQGVQPFSAGAAVALVDPVTNTTNGVQVTFTVPQGQSPSADAYWLIAVRPSTPQAVYPERLLTAPQLADGPREWVCPLAVIAWGAQPGQKVRDCRQKFDNLVELTKRPAGCCTVNVRPEDLSATNTLQNVVDRAVGLAQQVTVCLGPGPFGLEGSLRLGAAHNNLTLSACAGAATISPAAGAPASAFSDGLIVIANASGIALRGLSITPPSASLPQALQSELDTLAKQLGGTAGQIAAADYVSMIGVRVISAANLTIEDCTIEFPQPDSSVGSDVFGVGAYLQGDCSGLVVRGCSFSSQVAPTQTFPPAQANTGNIAGGRLTGALATAAPTTPVTTAAVTISAAPVVTPPVVAPPVFAPPVTPPPVVAPPLSSPPAAVVDLLSLPITDRIRNIVFNAPPGLIVKVEPPAPMIATLGLLACGTTTFRFAAADATSHICRLGDATIEANTFGNLTISALGLNVDVGTMLIHDNQSKGCVSGLLLTLNGAGSPAGASNQTLYSALTQTITGYTEALIALLLGEIYPLPSGVSDTVDASVTAASLFVTGNQIETLSESAGSNTALFVSANRTSATGGDTSASLIVANNRLRNGTGSFLVRIVVGASLEPTPAPTVLFSVADSARCAVTGNLVFNEPPPLRVIHGGSLYIIPDTNATVPGAAADTSTVSSLAVTGNVLMGPNNLSQLLRPAPATDTWVAYNALA
jgi:hypothetical protein